jgi:hypothetical protein
MSWKSVLKPEASVLGGIAEIGAVYGIYNLNLGPTAMVQATTPNVPMLESSRKKAGYASFAFVSGLFLITKDANMFILGCATIIAMEISYRHAIMANPDSGRIENPNPAADYQPAQNVIPFLQQGATG